MQGKPNAKKWKNKVFYHYEDYAFIFGKDRATGTHAMDVENMIEHMHVEDQDSSNSMGAFPAKSSVRNQTRQPSVHAKASASVEKRKKPVSPSLGECICQVGTIIAKEISKASTSISNAITTDLHLTERTKLVEVIDEIKDLSDIERMVFVTKFVIQFSDLIDIFISLKPIVRKQ